MKKMIRVEKKAAKTIQSGDLSITPYSQSLTVSLPYLSFLWNRPVSIEVNDGEKTTVIPIMDVTRIAQLLLLGFGIAVAFILWLIGRKASRPTG